MLLLLMRVGCLLGGKTAIDGHLLHLLQHIATSFIEYARLRVSNQICVGNQIIVLLGSEARWDRLFSIYDLFLFLSSICLMLARLFIISVDDSIKLS